MRTSAHSVARLSASTARDQRRAFLDTICHARSASNASSSLQLRRDRAAQFFRAAAEAIQIFLRQINAAHLVIAAHVANDIGQLKREAQPFGQIGRFRIAESKNVQARQPHGPGHAIAIFRKAVERRIRS